MFLFRQEEEQEEPLSLEARIAQIVARTATSTGTNNVSLSSKHQQQQHHRSSHHRSVRTTTPPRRHHHRRSHFKTQPYNEHDEQVMDDEELHSLLGV